MRIIIILLIWLYFFLFPKETVLIVQFKGVNDSVVIGVGRLLKKIYDVRIVVAKGYYLPDTAYMKNENKYDARKINNYLDSTFKADKVVGITNEGLLWDRFRMGWYEDIYGLGDQPGKSCVVSTWQVDSSKIVSETALLAVHEIGHTYGLPHCTKDSTCYMVKGDGSTKSIDICTHFCNSCKKLLKILHKW